MTRTDKDRLRKKVYGSLLKTIQTKSKLLSESEKREFEKPKERKKILDSTTVEEAVYKTIDYLVNLAETTDVIDLNTVYDYEERIERHVYDFFPRESKVSKINDVKIKEFISYMFSKEKYDGSGLLSVSTVEKVYSALSWVIRYSSEIADPPMLESNCLDKVIFKTLIPKGRTKITKRDRSHTIEEMKNLIDTLNKKANIRLKTMVNIIIDVGCRDEECSGLKWENIDLETGEINYGDAVTSSISRKQNLKYAGTRAKPLKSKHSYRKNYLTPETIQCLKNYKTFKLALGLPINDEDYIFTIWSENQILSPISFADEYGDFRRKYGFENIPLYDIRHVVSNTLLESGMSPKDVAMYMGNTPRTLLENYTNIREDIKKEMPTIINDKIRSNKQKIFSIDIITQVLNCNDKIENEEAYKLLDFVANKKIDLDDESWVIHNAKNLILSQHPILETFCNEDEKIVKAKLETYKTFNNSNIELTQDPNYYFPNIKL